MKLCKYCEIIIFFFPWYISSSSLPRAENLSPATGSEEPHEGRTPFALPRPGFREPNSSEDMGDSRNKPTSEGKTKAKRCFSQFASKKKSFFLDFRIERERGKN